MTTAEKTAAAIQNSRAKLTAGTGDYLDEVVVYLADERRSEMQDADNLAAAVALLRTAPINGTDAEVTSFVSAYRSLITRLGQPW